MANDRREVVVLFAGLPGDAAKDVVRELLRAGFSPIWEQVELGELSDALGRRHWNLVVASNGSPSDDAPLSLRLIAAQEAERERIAGAVHDQLGQLLTTARQLV